jgi:hypothetical protein
MTLDNSLANILASCLQAIESGKATVEDCVARYPEVKNLEAQLRSALAMRTKLRLTMVDSRKTALERRLVSAMNEKVRQQRVARRSRVWTRLGVVFAAVALVMVSGGVLLRQSAQFALPGDPLYPYKRGLEGIELAVAGSQEAALLEIANARITEVQRLAARGEYIEQRILDDMVAAVNNAMLIQTDLAVRADLYRRSQDTLLMVANIQQENKPNLDRAAEQIATPLGTPIVAVDVLPSATPTNTPTNTDAPTLTATFTPTFTNTPTETVNAPISTVVLPATTTVPATLPPVTVFTATSTGASAVSGAETVSTSAPISTVLIPSATPTSTETASPTLTETAISTETASPTPTATLTETATEMPTETATGTATETPTETYTPSMTNTFAPCDPVTPTLTPTPEGEQPTITPTETPSPTPCVTHTPQPSPTETPTATETLVDEEVITPTVEETTEE